MRNLLQFIRIPAAHVLQNQFLLITAGIKIIIIILLLHGLCREVSCRLKTRLSILTILVLADILLSRCVNMNTIGWSESSPSPRETTLAVAAGMRELGGQGLQSQSGGLVSYTLP